MYLCFLSFVGYTQCSMQIRNIRYADLPDRIPELAKEFCLSGSEEGEVRLIIGIDTGHQLDVRTVVIRETAIQRVTEFVIAPGPLLFSGGDVVVRDVYDACASRVIITAKKISARVSDHITGRDGNVRVPSQVVRRIGAIGNKMRRHLVHRHAMQGPLAVRYSVIRSLAVWELCDCPLGMIGDVAHVVGKEGLIVLVNARGQIGPPQEGLRVPRTIAESDLELEVSAPRTQADAMHAS